MEWFKNAIAFSVSAALYGMRMAAWVVLSMLRRPFHVVGLFVAFSGLVGGVLLMPAILYIGGAERGEQFPLWMYAEFVSVGFLSFVGGGLLVVLYDKLLFRLQPEDREVIYY